jgi:tripartite-type tricarboxylate transporter receptor subunit TctC
VRSQLPVSSAKDLIDYAKMNPEKLNYASQGHGTTSHLTAEMFELATGTQMVHVPFKGTAPALNGLLTNSVDLMFVDLAAAVPLFEAGNIKVLAVATGERLPEFPSLPTLEEVGLPEFRSTTWNGIVGPPKTSRAVVAKLNAAVNAVLTSPEIKDSFGKLRLIPLGGSPDEMAALIDSERARWSHIIKAAKVTLD